MNHRWQGCAENTHILMSVRAGIRSVRTVAHIQGGNAQQRYSKKMESRKTSPAKLLRKSNLPRVPSSVFDSTHQSSFSAQSFEDLAIGSCLDRNANIVIFRKWWLRKDASLRALGCRWCMVAPSIDAKRPI